MTALHNYVLYRTLALDTVSYCQQYSHRQTHRHRDTQTHTPIYDTAAVSAARRQQNNGEEAFLYMLTEC